jgi:hypothetical protein
MKRLILALRAFWAVLISPDAARFIERVLDANSGKARAPKSKPAESLDAAPSAPSTPSTPPREPAPAVKAPAPTRSDALTLLSTLQREARFLDLVQESLDGYSDAQVGAAAREVIRDCGKVIERCFQVQPLMSEPEGSQVPVSATTSAVRVRVLGKSVTEGTTSGVLLHAGWKAMSVQLPQWTGVKDDQMVLAPAEVEVS